MSQPVKTVQDHNDVASSLADDCLAAWLHLANLQLAARLTTALLDRFGGDPAAVFDADDADLDSVPGWMERHRLRLRDPALDVTPRQWNWFSRYGVKLILSNTAAYPTALREIPDPPPILFLRGEMPSDAGERVGIVGSRHATPYGRTSAERLARELAEAGVTVVSGGAVGIDAAAHRGAIGGGGKTIAILGCGLDVDYPRDNRALFEQIAEHGALVSEYPLGAQPEAWRFPSRNRIISGISTGVLVVEAPAQSGALITARCAAEHGRTLMAVPANIDRSSSVGSNELLKDGAIFVTETEDVLRAIGVIRTPARKTDQRAFDFVSEAHRDEPAAGLPTAAAGAEAPTSPPMDLPEVQLRLLSCLSETPRHIDSLALEVGITASESGVEMTLLELVGLVRRLPGNTYIRVS